MDEITSRMYIYDILKGCKAVKCYGYRNARITDRLVCIERESISLHEVRFAEDCGVNIDNHCAYQLITKSNRLIYIRFDDRHAVIGLGIDETKDPV